MTTTAPVPETGIDGWPSLTHTERAALRELLIHGPLSRIEISRRLNVSRANLTRVTRRLLETGLVAEGEAPLRGRAGRPGEMLLVRTDALRFLGVKLTGDTLFATVTNLRADILAERAIALPGHDIHHVVDLIADTRHDLADEHGPIVAAGVSLAGDVATVDGHPTVLRSVYLGWDDVRLTDLVEHALKVPVAVENDVRALTAAEHWFGVGAGCETMALVTVGVGIGIGLIHGGLVVDGAHGRAGRLDHLIVDPLGPICDLGHRGCVSVYLNNASIARALGEVGTTYDDVITRARSGDRAALRAFAEAGRALGVLVAVVSDFFDPEKIILTGDGLAVTELAGEAIGRGLRSAAEPEQAVAALDIRPFEFSEWARGAAVAAIRMLVGG